MLPLRHEVAGLIGQTDADSIWEGSGVVGDLSLTMDALSTDRDSIR